MTQVRVPPPEEQHALLVRNAHEVLPEGALLERLKLAFRDHRPLRVKQGFDPTAPDIHLGHTVGLRKLRQFQDLGHQVVLIVGDYTGMVGDPSGRSKARPRLSPEEVESNARTYLDQFYRVLERHPQAPHLPVEVHRNGEWFAPMKFMDVIRLAAEATVARLLERDDFADRYRTGQAIGLHELLYPLMQGYDSVAIRADLELGATEQKFNLLMGRALQESHGQPPQVILTLPVLPGTDGVQRMSKSLGNYIGVAEPPAEIYGKTMSLPDAVMGAYWELAAESDEDEWLEISRSLRQLSQAQSSEPRSASGDALAPQGLGPLELKKRLAHRLVSMYHGKDAADRAQANFEKQFTRREVPEDLAEWQAPTDNPLGIKDLLVGSGLAPSGNAAWRAVEQGAVAIDGKRITDRNLRVTLEHPIVIRLGRRMVRVLPRRGR